VCARVVTTAVDNGEPVFMLTRAHTPYAPTIFLRTLAGSDDDLAVAHKGLTVDVDRAALS
jgi:hypothetical protein